MPRNMFGWSLPPGVTNRMIEDAAGAEWCDVCTRDVESCICPECPVCKMVGDLRCYAAEPSDQSDPGKECHVAQGRQMKLNQEQVLVREKFRLRMLKAKVRDQEMVLDSLKDNADWDPAEFPADDLNA